MQKRLTTLFLLVAQEIIFGHGLFAHHHHDEFEEHTHLNTVESNNGKTDIGHLFSSIQHTGDQITYTNSEDKKDHAVKDTVKPFLATLPEFSMSWKFIITFQQNTFPPDRHITYQAPLHCGYSLRGPPIFIVA